MDLLLDLRAWLVIVSVSTLGALAALSYYYVGKKGTEAVLTHFPQIKPERWERAQDLYEEHGSGVLFLSSIPVAGVVLTAAAGVFGISALTFFFWVLLGRVARNWIFFIIFDETLRLVIGA